MNLLECFLPSPKSNYANFEEYYEVVRFRFKRERFNELSKEFKKTIELLYYKLNDEEYETIKNTRIEYDSFYDIIPYVNKVLSSYKADIAKYESPVEKVCALINIRIAYDNVIYDFITSVANKFSDYTLEEVAEHIRNSEGSVLYCRDLLIDEMDRFNISSITKKYIDSITTNENVEKKIDRCLNTWVNSKIYAADEQSRRINRGQYYDRIYKSWQKTRGNPKKFRYGKGN